MNRLVIFSCLLWLGCGGRPAAVPAADGGVVPSDAGASVLTDAGASASLSNVAPLDAAPRDSGTLRDASVPDAAEEAGPGGLIPVHRIYPDGGAPPPPPPAADPKPQQDSGQPMASDADGGEPQGDSCTTSRCYCEKVCELGLTLACPADGSMSTCLLQCDVPSSKCYDYFLRVLRCKSELPKSAYSCDPDLLVFVVGGCVAEENALQICRTN